MKLGKLPARIDNRTIPLRAIFRLLPELPPIYDVDESLGGMDDHFVFNNSVYGDCVIAARAHQTLRFEKYEQNIQIPITDQEVVNQYFKESGGLDMGLYLLNSLKVWRNQGWFAAGRNYTIYAFASVDWKDHEEVKHCIHLLGGVNFGMRVFQADMDQFNAGETWELTGNDGSFLGGHGVYLFGYDQEGLTSMTWGKRQRMSWKFWDSRVDEAYGIVDNRDEWVGDSPIDVNKLDAYLKDITQGNTEPSDCPFANAICGTLNAASGALGRKSRFKTVVYR